MITFTVLTVIILATIVLGILAALIVGIMTGDFIIGLAAIWGVIKTIFGF